MAELLKYVAQRLQGTAKAKVSLEGVHSDPNLLSAFAEKSLRHRERRLVLEHLAQCSSCREIVSYSIAQLDSQTVVSKATAARWLSWPVLRWSVGVASVTVIAALISLQHEKQTNRSADLSRDRVSAIPHENARPDVAAPEAKSKPAPNPTTSQLRREAGEPAPRANVQRYKSQPASSPEPSEQRFVSSTSEKKEVGSAPPASDVGDLVPGRAKDDPEGDRAVSLAGSATGGQVTDAERMMAAATAKNEGAFRARANLVPRWTLTSDGTLQRSLDSGRSWQAVPVAPQITFRALAANGLNVWVGGVSGALYHSADAGQHWSQIHPAVNGEPLTADIIGVEFTDLVRGKLTTSSGQTWETSDAGQTWSKR